MNLRSMDEIIDDRAFYFAKHRASCNERRAHLMTHEGPSAATIPGNAPPGPGCQFCVDIDRMIEHWRERLANG